VLDKEPGIRGKRFAANEAGRENPPNPPSGFDAIMSSFS
jgi:hypothetical protein